MPDFPQRVQPSDPVSVGRYLVFDALGSGGMATVHLGLMSGAVGFRRAVAVKRLHAQFANDPEFCAQLVDEAKLAARIHHANVVQTIDVVWTGEELALVLEYVDGDTLAQVLKAADRHTTHLPIEIACSVLSGVLHGLHAAHTATDDRGVPLNIVHRDVSPQNILIGRDGLARVLDFGVARARARIQTTQTGFIKGKFGYMAPEQVRREQVDCRSDVFAAGIVLWEAVTRRRLFDTQGKIEQIIERVAAADIPPASKFRPDVPQALDRLIAKALARRPDARFQTAEEFAIAIEQSVTTAGPHAVKSWIDPLVVDRAIERARRIDSVKRYQGALPSSSEDSPIGPSLGTEARAKVDSHVTRSGPSSSDVTVQAAIHADPSRSRSWRALVRHWPVPIVGLAAMFASGLLWLAWRSGESPAAADKASQPSAEQSNFGQPAARQPSAEQPNTRPAGAEPAASQPTDTDSSGQMGADTASSSGGSTSSSVDPSQPGKPKPAPRPRANSKAGKPSDLDLREHR